MDFVVIDVETANPDMSSICQIGLAAYSDGQLAAEWVTLVDPQSWFSPFNVQIHGIDESAVRGAPTLPDVRDVFLDFVGDAVLVSHTPFDRVSIHQAFESYELEVPSFAWLDSARVARRTWPECSQRGYGLANVCGLIGYEFEHHDALEDAKAAGQVMLAAMSVTGLSVSDWLTRVERPIDPSAASASRIAVAGNPDGPLFGEVTVFTGALQIPRREAAALAGTVGCDVVESVSKKTTMLVVGDQDVAKLAGHDKSSKHRKAVDLIAHGHAIKVLRESDFLRLVSLEADARGF